MYHFTTDYWREYSDYLSDQFWNNFNAQIVNFNCDQFYERAFKLNLPMDNKPRNKNELLILLFITMIITLLLASMLHLEIVTPDTENPADIKPNLEQDLRPIKEAIVKVLLGISAVFGCFILLIFSLKKRKNWLN